MKYLIEGAIEFADSNENVFPLINSLASLNNLISQGVFGNLEYDNMGTLKSNLTPRNNELN